MIENTDGEQLDTIVTELFNDMGLPLVRSNVNRALRIGPRTSITNRKQSRPVIIQYKHYTPNAKLMKTKKTVECSHFRRSNTKASYTSLYLCRDEKKIATSGPLVLRWQNYNQGYERQNRKHQSGG